MRKRKLFWIVPLAILGVALFAYIGGEIVMRLWNWLLPPLFGWRQINVWQGLGLLVLCRILFGGTGGHGSGKSRVRRSMEERMSDRCAHMTPEERERFLQRMRDRWGFRPSPGESKGQ